MISFQTQQSQQPYSDKLFAGYMITLIRSSSVSTNVHILIICGGVLALSPFHIVHRMPTGNNKSGSGGQTMLPNKLVMDYPESERAVETHKGLYTSNVYVNIGSRLLS